MPLPSFFLPGLRTVLLLAVGVMADAGAQEPLRNYPPPQQRFEGVVQVGAGGRREAVRLDLRSWILAPGLRHERLPLPQDAVIIIELHAGELETIVGNERTARHPGAIWRVGPGEPMALSTGDDSVTLTTLVLRSR